MTIFSPTHYVPAKALPNGDVVPLWSAFGAQTLEYEDVWKEIRIDKRHNALHHVKLPSSCVIPPKSVGTVSPPLWTDSSYNQIPGINLGYWESNIARYSMLHYFYEMTVTWKHESYVAVVDAVVSFSVNKGRDRQLSITGVARFIRVQTDKTATVQAVRSSPSSTVTRSYAWALGIPEESEVKDAVQEFLMKMILRDQSGGINVYPWNWTDSWEPDKLKAYVSSEITRGLKFEDGALVEDHTHIVRDSNPLSKHHQWMKEKSRGSPMWVHSDLEFQKGKALAYLDALSSMKTASLNMLQNIASIYQILTSFAFQPDETADLFESLVSTQSPINAQGLERIVAVDMPSIPDFYKNAWLGGRYVFSTSVSDLGQGWSYFYEQAQRYLGTRSNESKCHGTYQTETATFSCTFVIEEKALQGVNKYFEALYRLGLEPNSYVMWDFVPYSFVVDWFLPIGDALNAYVVSSHYTPEYYNYVNTYGEYAFCYSVHYYMQTSFGQAEVYTRWYECDPPNVDTSYVLLDKAQVSSKTSCWRFVDGLCLVL